MNFIEIAGKLVNEECIEFVNFRTDEETGKIYCLYELSSGKVLEEVFTDYKKFKEKMTLTGVFEQEETEKTHLFKKLCIIIEKIINKIKGEKNVK